MANSVFIAGLNSGFGAAAELRFRHQTSSATSVSVAMGST